MPSAYGELVSEFAVHPTAQAEAEAMRPFRGPKALMQDARLVADALGVYLTTSGQHDALEAAKAELGRLD